MIKITSVAGENAWLVEIEAGESQLQLCAYRVFDRLYDQHGYPIRDAFHSSGPILEVGPQEPLYPFLLHHARKWRQREQYKRVKLNVDKCKIVQFKP